MPEFSVEDCQSLALFIQTQLKVAPQKVNTRDEACVVSDGLLYLVNALEQMDRPFDMLVKQCKIDDEA